MIKKLDLLIEKFTRYLLVFSVLALLVLSTSSIFFRWIHVSLLWIEPLIRHLVFLIAFLGGTIATGKKTHIGIDILGKYFENKGNIKAKKIVDSIINLVSFCTLLLLIYASVEFLKMESKYAKEVFWGIKSNYLIGIIPFGFSLMAIRFFALFITELSNKEVS